MTDKELALAFFKRIQEKGFQLEIVDFYDIPETDEDFNPYAISLKDSLNKTFMTFDFLNDDFYRISGTDSTG